MLKFLLIIFICFISISVFSQNNFRVIQPHNRNSINLERIQKEKSFNIFPNTFIYILGLYDISATTGGIDLQFNAGTPYMDLPLEVQWIINSSFRFRAWPRIFFSQRTNEIMKETKTFISPYFLANMKINQAWRAHAELGLGAGIISKYFRISAWFSYLIHQGDFDNQPAPLVADLFSFRANFWMQPVNFFHFLISFKIGPAILKVANITTSVATTDLEGEIGFNVYKGFLIKAAVEARTDNIGALINDKARVNGIDESFKILAKLGIGYKF